MFGRLIAGLIVVGLAIGVWALWPSGDSDTTTTTAPIAAPTTTTTASPTTSTTTPTTTTEATPDLIDTAAEAEEVLRHFWFGWFEGIYNQDEERIKEVVASQNQLDAARQAFDLMTFSGPPLEGSVALSDVEILRSDSQCAAIWATLDVSDFRGSGAQTAGVHVLRLVEDTWKSVSTWDLRNDLWEQDCDAQLEPLA